jgi:uncharacterized protein with gpF-like domain
MEAVANPYDWEGRLKLWNNKLLLDIKQNVTDGLTQGLGLVKTTKNIQSSFETNLGKRAADKITRSNILRVVRTESTRAQELGNQSGFYQAQSDAESLGFDTLKMWDATLDSRTRPNHGAMEDKPADKDGMFHFTTMDGNKILVEGPHLTNTTDDINCRCNSRIQIKGLEPSVRRDNENKTVIKYTTYDNWKKVLK